MNSRLVFALSSLALFLFLHGDIKAQSDDAASAAVRFADPAFWEIVGRGPASSVELEHVVTTYAANEMFAEVEQAFADYIIRTELAAHPYCGLCLSLLKSVDTAYEDPLAERFIDSTDIVLDDAFARAESDAVIRLAILTSMSHFHEHHDLSLYFLSAAAQIGIDDAWRDEVMQVLTTLGLYSQALEIANHVYFDGESEHYQSETLSRWIAFIEQLIDRRDKVGAYITAAMQR